jgi:glycosyltransferase involved in cell wall biosynthesis
MSQQAGVSGKGNVCFVRHGFYPSESSVRREAETLREEGYSVYVICLRGQGEAASEVVDGVEIRRLPVAHRRGKVSRYLFEYNAFFVLASLELIRLHLRCRLRAVQVNTMPDYLVFSSLLLRSAGVKVILHMHEPMPELFSTIFYRTYYRPIIKAIEFAERLSLAYADRVLTVTNEMRENFGRRGADVGKITVVLNVPESRVLRPDRFTHLADRVARTKEKDQGAGVFRLLCHGTIEHRYGLDTVVDAVARVKGTIPGIQFRFMGKGTHLPAVLARAEGLGITSHVHHLGYLPFETMIEEILCADVALVPMRRNPYSILVHTNKMYEYIALGCPIIASRLDSVASYFPTDSLLYFEPDDDADLAEKIIYAFGHPDELQSRVRRTKELYETYRWDLEKRKYLGTYATLLASPA